MANIAFVPVRGGSQSIPLKNIKKINGKPLVYWCLEALENSASIDKIVLASDSQEIINCVVSFNFKKLIIYNRQAENATHTASTESVLLEYLYLAKHKAQDQLVLVQATNPFVTSQDFDKSLQTFKKNKKAKSLLSVVRTKRFFWSTRHVPINYQPLKRPRRQDYEGLFMENGAFYISSVGQILRSKNRLSKPYLTYEMPEHSGFEIDEPDDWIICEHLLKKYKYLNKDKSFNQIKLFLSDVDGVLTDAGMYYSENGDELKKFSTYDGMGFKLIQKLGIKVGILTAEDRNLNRNRARKLNLDFDIHGVKDKLSRLNELLSQLNLDLSEVAYVGDDVNDIEILKHVGFAFCPTNAIPEVKAIQNIIQLAHSGGEGVIREIYDFLKSN